MVWCVAAAAVVVAAADVAVVDASAVHGRYFDCRCLSCSSFCSLTASDVAVLSSSCRASKPRILLVVSIITMALVVCKYVCVRISKCRGLGGGRRRTMSGCSVQR